MKTILLDLNKKSPSISASAIISKDGLIIASILPKDLNENVLGGITAALFSVGFCSTQEFVGSVEQLMVRGSLGYILIAQAGNEAFLTVITKNHAELDQIFLELNRSAKKVIDCIISSK